MDDFKFGREELGGTSVFQVKLRENKKKARNIRAFGRMW